ncbi:MAG: hypothetical protein NO515_05770, partial [Candidatus Methanomethylicia archaeon]|nr:hypothetical protein [Candidatus Methanomethylicia archaeon]
WEFERMWRAQYGKDFERMRLAARVFRNMRDRELERVMAEARRAGLLERLTFYDMDLQGGVIGRLARSRLARHAVLPLLRSFFEG